MKFNGLVPELSVTHIDASKNFYVEVLGFKMEYERIEDSFVFLSLGEAQIMLEEINGNWNTAELQHPFGRGINFQIESKDVDGLAAGIRKKNMVLFKDVFVSHYECGGQMITEKEILVQDPDGYLLRFSETIGG